MAELVTKLTKRPRLRQVIQNQVYVKIASLKLIDNESVRLRHLELR